ncbi:MAG: FtsX-like permease family protein [Anaerolineaceae bacterium]|nr:FtsX-like permease family protein [Anaerolineaceae bacterium]
MLENMRIALVGLGSNKLRTVLTMLGITIGVAAVIILVSLGQGVDNYVRQQFLGVGTNLVVIFPRQNDQGIIRRLTLNDVRAISDPFKVPDALAIMPQRTVTRTVTFEGRQISVRVLGVTPNYITVRSRSVIVGQFFTADDMDSQARVAVLGQETAKRLFPSGTDPIGKNIRIMGISFKVTGILNAVGGSGFGASDDDLIAAPLTTVQNRLSGDRDLSGARPISNIIVQARDNQSVNSLAGQLREALRQEHRISFRDEDDFQIFTQEDLLGSLGKITGLLTVFLAVIAGISLLVGGIGIMNIMLVTVTERTREIGLRKAVGAQKIDILVQFLVEAAILALLGGSMGVLVAAGSTLLVSKAIPELNASVQFSSVLLATMISLAIGIFFGIYPANRAASLNPIDALRYE